MPASRNVNFIKNRCNSLATWSLHKVFAWKISGLRLYVISIHLSWYKIYRCSWNLPNFINNSSRALIGQLYHKPPYYRLQIALQPGSWYLLVRVVTTNIIVTTYLTIAIQMMKSMQLVQPIQELQHPEQVFLSLELG